MRLITFFACMTCAPVTFAHMGSTNNGSASELLHFLFAPHHLPMLTLLIVAAIVIMRLGGRATKKRQSK